MLIPADIEVGIALSGGGARGIAHIGVLQALEDYGIFVKRVSGTSMGAIVGALYCEGIRPIQILEIVSERRFINMFRWRLLKTGLLPLDYLEEKILEYIPHNSFEGLKMPLHICVSNLSTGNSKIVSSGPLMDWVKASASIPVLFPPVTINNEQFVDGGLTNNLPVEPLLEHANRTIGVHVNHNLKVPQVSGIKSVAERVYRLAIWQTVKDRMDECDLVIDPIDARKYGTFDFNQAQELFNIGYKATEEVMYHLTKNINLEKLINLHQRKSPTKEEGPNQNMVQSE